jgi:hypothetical protein
MMITHKHLAAEGCRKQDAVVQQDLEQEVAVHFGISEYRKLPIYRQYRIGHVIRSYYVSKKCPENPDFAQENRRHFFVSL